MDEDDPKYCKIGGMPKAWCAHCRNIKAPEEEKSAEEEFWDDLNRNK